MEATSLIEDPEHASVQQIVAEAMAAGGGSSGGVGGHSVTAPGQAQSPWISPAPISIKLRLFCLPYAGGISENVYGR